MFGKRKVVVTRRKRSMDGFFVFSENQKRRSASTVFSVRKQKSKKSNFKFEILNFKSHAYRQAGSLNDKISNLKLPKLRFRNSALKRATAVITLIATIATVYFQFAPQSQGASYTWNQTTWTSQTANTPVHLTNATGWEEYAAADANISPVNGGADIEISANAYTATDDGTFSSTGSATGGGFDNGIHNNTVVSGTGTGASVQINTGNAASVQTSDTDFSGGTHSDTVVSGTGDAASITLPGTLTASAVTHTADTDFSGTHTNTEVSGTGNPASVQLQTAQTAGTYESQTIDFGTGFSAADYETATFNQTAGAGSVNMAWGQNNYGQLGDDTTTNTSLPIQTLNLTDVVTVSAGASHSLALKSDGTVWAWGFNNVGRLGNGTTTNSYIPVQVKDTAGTGWLTDVTAISAALNHSLALKSDGTVWAWGLNNNAQLGDGTTTQRLTPVQIMTDVIAISAGSSHSLALKTDGTVWAWGHNGSGGLGIGYKGGNYVSTPIQVKDIAGTGWLTDIIAISVGGSHSLAIKNDGTVWAWGVNSNGQLGDGTLIDKYIPIQVKDMAGTGWLTDIIAISAGSSHSLALKNDGTVWAWGFNGNGILGDGTVTRRTIPVQVKDTAGTGWLTDIAAISAASNHSLALKNDGTVWAWGNDGYGQLGYGTTTAQRIIPVQVKDTAGTGWLTDATAISAGTNYSLAISGGMRLEIAGKDADAAWTSGDYLPLFRPNGSASRAIIPGSLDGKRYVRYKASLVTPDSTYTPKLNSLTVNVSNKGSFTSGAIDLGAARQFTGRSFSFVTTIPTEIAGNRVRVRLSKDGLSWYGPGGSAGSYYDFGSCSVSTGTYTCPFTNATATILNGTANIYYQVFLDTPLSTYLPTLDSITINYHNYDSGTFESATIDLGGGASFSGIDSDKIIGGGSVNMAWGYNIYGILGTGDGGNRDIPTQTIDLTDVVAVSAGNTHTLALKNDGTVWAWGLNSSTQLGDGTSTNRSAPVQVKDTSGTGWLTDVIAISAAGIHSLALKSDGTVWAWGSNAGGVVLGIGSGTGYYNTPRQVKDTSGTGWLTDVIAISTRSNHSLALKADGTVWAWGYNSYGQLGDNTTTQRSTPVQVKDTAGTGWLTDITMLAAGDSHSMALKADGTVWAWGLNQYGRLGDNSISNRSTPVQVKDTAGTGWLTDVSAISAGSVHSMALKSDGTAWAWGSNGNGQLGDNSTNQRNTPVQVKDTAGTGWLTDITMIAAGYLHSMALKADSTVWAWGRNTNSQTGNESSVGTTYVLKPVQTSKLTDATAIAAGNDYSLAISGGMHLQIAGKETDSGWVEGDFKFLGKPVGSSKLVVPSEINGKRYIRYKVSMHTVDATHTIALNSLTLNYSQYSLSQTLTSSAFNTTDAANTPASLAWSESLVAGTDIKFQVRTSANGSAWSAWCGPDDGVPGSCNSATYFTDPTGGETMDDILTDQTNDQWIQYQATLVSSGIATPTLSDVTFTYVVNATPEIQNAVAFQSTDGIVTVNYELRDPDTTTGVTQGVVDIGLQYCTANCSTPGSETWVNASTLAGNVGPSVAVQEVNYNSYTLTWNSQKDYPNQTNATDFKVRVVANDSEIANNIGYGQSNTFAFDTDSPPEVQTVSASQSATGTVTVSYETKDPDTTNPLAATPGFVDVTLQYCIANCSTPGGETWADATDVTGNAGSVAVTGTFAAKSLVWNPNTDYDGQYNPTNFKVRVKVDDGEITNNLDYAESTSFILDTKNPTNVGIAIDHTKSSQQLTFTTPSDDSTYQMLVSNLVDFSDATAEVFASPYTFTLTDDPATVYLRIIDAYGNYTDVSGTTPAKVQNLVYYDTSNVELGEYREFLAWGVVSALQVGNGFASYDIHRSEDNITFAKIGESTDRNINYYVDNTVQADTHYYYKVVTVDINGNTSSYSATIDDTPNGQGGTDSTSPTLTSLHISNISTTSAKITWTTDELADTLVGFSSQAECDANAGVCPYLPERGLSAMVLEHEITLTHLDPDTVYHIRIRSHDVVGNLGQNDKDAPGANPIPSFSFQTLPGPAISGVTVSSNNTQAEVSWVTTTDSDSYVVYSDTVTNGALVSPLEVGTPNFVGGEPTYNHSQTINTYNDAPMIPGTTYYFYVKSKDIDNNVATDDNGGSFYTLVTTQDDDPPIISNPNAAIISNVEAAINWTTDEAATSLVNYGEEEDVYTYTAEVLTFDKSHYVILSSLSPNTTYYYTVTSSDINDNEATSEEYSFTTLMDPAQQHPPLAALFATIEDVEYDLTELSSIAVFKPTVLTDVSAVIEFETDQIAMCDIQYRAEGQAYNPTDFIIEETGYNIDHSMHIMSLVLDTMYYYKIECVDNLPAGQAGSVNSVEFSFITLEKQYGETTAKGLGDSTAPTISSVSVGSITGESVIITWKTDEAANSLVTYSLDGSEISRIAGNYLNVTNTENNTTSHSVTINGLIPSSKYTFAAISYDTAGNVGQSPTSTFTTKAPSELSSVKAVPRSLTEAVVTWETGSDTSSIVEYGLTTSYGETKESQTKTKLHEIVLSDLQSGQLYHFRVKSEDDAGNIFASTDNTFQQKTPPQISGLEIGEITERKAKINFTTNVPTDVLVTYTDLQDASNSGVQGTPTFATKHDIELKNLTPGREFSLKIRVRDEEGNEMEEEFSTFSTIADNNPPQIEQIKTDSALTQSDKVQTIISWMTDEPAMNKIVYKEGMGGEEKETLISEELTIKNSAVFTIFKPGTVYYFKIKSIDESENEAVSQEYALLTPRRRENIIQIIVANFEEIFRWTNM